jgi:hypothetical protein
MMGLRSESRKAHPEAWAAKKAKRDKRKKERELRRLFIKAEGGMSPDGVEHAFKELAEAKLHIESMKKVVRMAGAVGGMMCVIMSDRPEDVEKHPMAQALLKPAMIAMAKEAQRHLRAYPEDVKPPQEQVQ